MEDDIYFDETSEDYIDEPNMALARVSHSLFLKTGNIGYHNFGNLLKADQQEFSDYLNSVKQEDECCLEG